MCGPAGHLHCGARQQTAAAAQAVQLKNTLALGLCECVTSVGAETKEKVFWSKTFVRFNFILIDSVEIHFRILVLFANFNSHVKESSLCKKFNKTPYDVSGYSLPDQRAASLYSNC